MAHTLLDRWLANRFVTRVAHKAVFGGVMLLCMFWSVWAAVGAAPVAPQAAAPSPAETGGEP